MLIDCPECEHRVSDLAVACPGCGFPVREELARRAHTEAIAADRGSRSRVGTVACPWCDGRGFRMVTVSDEDGERQGFEWCSHCEHTGNAPCVKSERGYWAISTRLVEVFVAGDLDEGDGVQELGADAPTLRE